MTLQEILNYITPLTTINIRILENRNIINNFPIFNFINNEPEKELIKEKLEIKSFFCNIKNIGVSINCEININIDKKVLDNHRKKETSLYGV